MTNLLSGRDYFQIGEAARILGVSEQTLRNWDRAGKLRASRHPINGYRLYRASELHELLREFPSELEGDDTFQLILDLAGQDGLPNNPPDGPGSLTLPPCHWSPAVALDPRHRPQRWDAPSTTVRRDWRKYPQEAHVLDRNAAAYRRLSVEEIAILQGFNPAVVLAEEFTNRQLIAALGDAVPPPLARAIVQAVDAVWKWGNRTALEICAGIGGLAEGAASIDMDHKALIDSSPVCEALLKHNRAWKPSAVYRGDVRSFDYQAYRSKIGLLSGGPPCQPWSQSGRRLGQDDERDLLSHLDQIVQELQPEVFIFENVPGLATIANQQYLRHVVDRLREPSSGLSYGVMVGILNAADFGVPQVRRRLFILGFRDRPSAFAGHCFAEIERQLTHADPASAKANRHPWLTIGEALQDRQDPGGWRQWISRAA